MAPVPVVLEFATFVAVASATAATAILVLAADHRRNWNQWLAFFLLLVAGNFAFQALNRGVVIWAAELGLAPAAAGRFDVLTIRLADALQTFDPAVLAYFASFFPRRTLLAQRWWGVPLLAAPALFFLGVEGAGLAAVELDLAFSGYLAACYLYALGRLLSNYATEPSSVMATQLRPVVLGVFVAIASRVALVPKSHTQLLVALFPGTLAFGLSLALRLAILGVVVLASWMLVRALARGARLAEARSLLRLSGAAFGAFAVLWTLEVFHRARAQQGLLYPSPWNELLEYIDHGLVFAIRWMVFSAAMLVGIVRYEALGVGLQAAGSTGLGLAAVAGFVAAGAAASVMGPWVGAAVAVVAMAAGFALVQRATGTSRAGPAQRYLHQRSLDAYRALVARTVAEGPLDEARERGLAAVRRKLAISEREHQMVVAIAQAEEARGGGEVLLGRYEVLRRLGAGASAVVYLARDRETGGAVVLKRLRADLAGARGALDASVRELAVARRVSHPRLVAIHDVAPVPDGAVVVMEFAEGGSLRDLLAQRGPLPAGEVASLVRQAAEGLGALHAAGIVHGDLKPENILLTAGGEVKLADFGTARALETERTLVKRTRPAAALGTLLYMAPEQARGEPPSPSSDVYALGSVAYEILTGQPLVLAEGRGIYEVVQEVARGAYRGGVALPPGWPEFLARALAPSPAERFESADELLRNVPGRQGASSSAAARLRSWSATRSEV